MKKLLTIFILLSASTYGLYAQIKSIKGRVIDNTLETLAYIPIMINDTVKVGKTDLKGFFHVEVPDSVKKLSFIGIGIELTNIELTDNCDKVEVVMMLGSSYDFMTFKKIDKLRMKEFKKLPEIHREAFEKGIFKTEEACYKQEFIPFYKKKQMLY